MSGSNSAHYIANKVATAKTCLTNLSVSNPPPLPPSLSGTFNFMSVFFNTENGTVTTASE